ncbi:MAG: gamma-glutamylcyclotransferase [Bradymonadaceae bacterium]|nr:gamma-glutamylcyclotransferase [Lujinxingiaceae bacterium]
MTELTDSFAIFTYGTLQPNGRYWPQVEDFVTHHVAATINGYTLWHLPEGYPAILEGEGTVHGRLLFVERARLHAALIAFDRIEDFVVDDPGSLYERVRLFATHDDATTEAFGYLYHPNRRGYVLATGVPVTDGDWNRHVKHPTACAQEI